MARTCSVCASPHLHQVDEGLAEGASLARLAKVHGLSERALRRHRESHLPAPAVEAREESEQRRGDDLVGRARAAEAVVWEALERARAERDSKIVLMAVDRVFRAVECQARLRGELAESAPVVVRLNVPGPAPIPPHVWDEEDFHNGKFAAWAKDHGADVDPHWRPQ